MRILFVVPYVPTPIRVRPYSLLTVLAGRGHRLSLATLWTTPEERSQLPDLAGAGIQVLSERLTRWQSVANCLGAMPGRLPLQAAYCRSRALSERIGRELAEAERAGDPYDIVHVEHLRGACYGLALDGPPVVWDSVDCISLLFEQASRRSRSLVGKLTARLDLGRTRHYEGWLVGRFRHVLVTSAVDKLALDGLAPDRAARITVLPNGVDLDRFAPTTEPRDPRTIVFSGKMSYHANISAAVYLVRELMPRVWSEEPQAKLVIAGADPTPDVRRLADEFPTLVQVTGTVPDLRPYLQRATVAAVPIEYGVGIQNKVLEAMACGTPVVATPQACGALAATAGQDLLVAASPAEFVRGLVELLRNPGQAAMVGSAGRRYVETHHRWSAIAEQLEGIYRDAAAESRP